MDGLIGREWVRFRDLAAVLANFSREEFLARTRGPYLLEIPLEESERQAVLSHLEASTEDVSGLYGPARGRGTETQRVPRPWEADDGTTSMSIDDLLRRRRKRAEMRVAFVGSHRRTTLGRDGECHLAIAGRAVSRLHAAIERTPDGRWMVVDLDSRNGTLLNGRRIPDRSPVQLAAEEQMLQLGDWRCAVLFPRRLWETSRRTP